MQFRKSVDSFFQLIKENKTLEAIDQFYHEEVETRENSEVPKRGKDLHYKMEEKNLAGVKNLRTKIPTLLIDDESEQVMGEMYIEFENLNGQAFRLEEAFIQKWQGNKMKYMRFYYKEIRKA